QELFRGGQIVHRRCRGTAAIEKNQPGRAWRLSSPDRRESSHAIFRFGAGPSIFHHVRPREIATLRLPPMLTIFGRQRRRSVLPSISAAQFFSTASAPRTGFSVAAAKTVPGCKCAAKAFT